MSVLFLSLLEASILAIALIGGVFLAFSDFIMRSLAKVDGHGGVEAMQSINREVFRWVFMALFLGMAVLSLIFVGYGLFGAVSWATTSVTMAGVVYLVGCFAVTAVFNVPLNTALASKETSLSATRLYWLDTYVPRWSFWNTIRTLSCIVSAALLLVGLP